MRELERLLERSRLRLRREVHRDHVGGVPHLVARWGVTVAAHPATADRVRGLCRVDRTLVDGEVLDLGTRRLRVVFTPGHTPGHHAFLEETTGLVMAGDLVAGVGTVIVDPDEGDMVDYLASIARYPATVFDLRPLRQPLHRLPASKRSAIEASLLYWADSYDAIIFYREVTPVEF